ncbi:MAG: sensor histidine kinase [Bacillota bacterium]
MIKKPKKPRTIFGKLMFSHLIVVVISLIVIGFFLTYLMENYFISARELEIVSQARDFSYLIGEDLVADDLEAVRKSTEALAYSLDAKIRVLNYRKLTVLTIDPEMDEEDGIESEEGVGLEEREIEHVFHGNMLTKKVYGPAMQRVLVAAPILQEEHSESRVMSDNGEEAVLGAVALSVPLRGIEESLAQISRLMLYSGFIGVIVAGIFAFSLSKTLARPLQKINKAALDMAAGNFHCKIEEESDDEIGELIKTFNHSVEQVEKNLEEHKRLENLRRNLVANVSHELKAPLASVRGFSELMLDGLIDEKEKERYLQIVLDNSVHLSKLVDDLLTLSHLESGQIKLEREEINIDDLARWSFDSVAPHGEEKGVKLSFNTEHNLAVMHGDRHRMHEVLVNLLENALQYTPPGGEVSFKIYQKKRQVVFEVRDTGCGIPEEELLLIFERFYKVDKARRRSGKGSGLGLAISKQLVELHGGTIEVESELNKGSVFRVYLPLHP